MIDQIQRFVLPVAYSVLPTSLNSAEASALLLAIGLQESRFSARRQLNGPARSFWMFEAEGARGVLTHPKTDWMLRDAGKALCYPSLLDLSNAELLAALEHNDALAACFARALLWTSPVMLPAALAGPTGWGIYTSLWRPGKPRPETWDALYAEAWARIVDNNAVLT